jgi:hypothetical protein
MYGDLFLLERESRPTVKAERLAFGDTGGRDEKWLQRTLFEHPELLPLGDIDPAFSPATPLCRELRTPAGPIDIAFMNSSGYLTLVECKLWRNPEARRKVVAQVLDYARHISGWSYADLQREVAAATHSTGNVPYDLVRAVHPNLTEHRFVDDTTRALRSGRFLLLIAGDGIREDVGGITSLINRNASSAFSFGLVEVALYGFEDGSIAIQPRVTAKTQLIERTVILLSAEGAPGSTRLQEREFGTSPVNNVDSNDLGESPQQAEYRRWWEPIMSMRFDDPEQDQPRLYWRNYVRTDLPWPSPVWLVAYRSTADGIIGVYLAGRGEGYRDLIDRLSEDRNQILQELPPGTEFRKFENSEGHSFILRRRTAEFESDDAARDWVRDALNSFVNSIRPRLKQMRTNE